MTPKYILRSFVMSSMLLVPPGLFVAGCDDAEEVVDCGAICDDFQRCFNSDLDVGQCRERCADKSDVNDDVRQDADNCAACIEDKACAEAVADCDQCDEIYVMFGTDG